ncbi:hypothetical protein CMV_021980 [Castanea mollissima]|uniref:Uncharacterized protein n=1 Tax=Castanea mollissima TaxID=60419 RepID=A0A8J4QVG6_9ROSI|nr:hypothetical protein CMV_021980 [Castanea mollissima]
MTQTPPNPPIIAPNPPNHQTGQADLHSPGRATPGRPIYAAVLPPNPTAHNRPPLFLCSTPPPPQKPTTQHQPTHKTHNPCDPQPTTSMPPLHHPKPSSNPQNLNPQPPKINHKITPRWVEKSVAW